MHCIPFPGFPSFSVQKINIEEDKAMIFWTLDVDLVDRVLVRAIDANNEENYVETNVEDLYVEPVSVNIPQASKFVFDFELYQGEDLVVYEPRIGTGSGKLLIIALIG